MLLTCQCDLLKRVRRARLGCGQVVGRAEEEHVRGRGQRHRRVEEHRVREHGRREEEAQPAEAEQELGVATHHPTAAARFHAGLRKAESLSWEV